MPFTFLPERVDTLSKLRSGCLEKILKYAGFWKPAPNSRRSNVLYTVSAVALRESAPKESAVYGLEIKILSSGRGFPGPGHVTGLNERVNPRGWPVTFLGQERNGLYSGTSSVIFILSKLASPV